MVIGHNRGGVERAQIVCESREHAVLQPQVFDYLGGTGRREKAWHLGRVVPGLRRLHAAKVALELFALSIRCRCSDRSNFGEPLDCVLVVPADGGFPCGRCLRSDVERAVVKTGGVVGQHQVKVGDVDV